MKFFNGQSISWLILMLHLQLGTLESLSDEKKVFSGYYDTPTFNHIAIHKVHGTVFVGAINRLYKLSSDLEWLDSEIANSNSGRKNYNKILVINYREKSLIACGYSIEYVCQTYRSVNNVNKLTKTDEIKVDGISTNGTNLSVVGLIADDDWREKPDGISKLYFAFSYGGYSTNFSALSIEKLKVGRILEIYQENNLFASEAFNTHYRDSYAVNYVYGFNSGQYNYFLTIQKKYNQEDSPYISKVIRICFNGQSLWQGYAEIPIDCEFEDGNTYNLIQAANVGKPNSQLAISLNINTTDDLLYAVFSKSRDLKNFSNEPSNHSALCIYSLESINEKFIENIQNCFDGNGDRGFKNLSPNDHCFETNEQITSQFCSSPVNMPLSGNRPITASPVITFNTQLTSIVTKTSENYSEVFVGTKTGHLKKIVVKDMYGVCELADSPIDEGSPINSDLLFSPDNTYLYVMTEHRLTRIKAPEGFVDCSKYQVNNTCHDTAPKYCGWCEFLSQCTTRCDCFYRNYYYWRSTNLEDHVQVIRNDINQFHIGLISAFLIHNKISLEEGIRVSCEYVIESSNWISYGDFHSEGVDNVIKCPVPGVYHFPKIAAGRNYWTANLLISTLQNVKISFANIIFFDCDIYTSYKACMFSTFKCEWCPTKNKCMYASIHTKLCPTKNMTQIISISSEVHANLNFTDVGMNICNHTSNLKCVINIEDNSYTKKAFNVTDTHSELSVIVNKCQFMANNCTSCLTLNAEYNCGWCLSSNTCELRSNCDGQRIEHISTCPDLHPPFISSFSPQQGPLEGGTNITIKGESLGYAFEDIIDIEVARVACKPFKDQYIPTKSITCGIEKSSALLSHEGPVVVNVNKKPVTSKQYFKFLNPKILEISPSRGPIYGGTELTVKGENLDVGKLIQVFIGNETCPVFSLTPQEIKCVTNSSVEQNATVRVEFDQNVHNFTNNTFEYVKDPEHDEKGYNIRPKGIPVGGVTMFMHIIPTPEQELIFQLYNENCTYKSPCKRQNDSVLTCPSPHLPDIETNSIDPKNPKEMSFSITGNSTGENISFSKNQAHKFLLYPNPEFHNFFNSTVKINGESFVIIKGKNINKACQKIDIKVYVGNYSCEVISISSNQLICRLPKSSSGSVDYFEVGISAHYNKITVSIGDHLNVTLMRNSNSSDLKQGTEYVYVLIIIIIFSIVSITSILILCMINKKRVAKTVMKLKKTKLQMTRLELGVASECKEAFAELQTQTAAFVVDDLCFHLPFLSYHNYVKNILFSNDHSIILGGKAILIHKEKGLRLFEELITNKIFLLSFVRTLEKQESFSMKDRVYVASMIMITLQKNMEYCTDILKTLLAELIDKNMQGKGHAKLLFRSTESIVEKMFSAWFSFLLYEFLKKSAGQPLFNLFNAMKEHVTRGPVDMITSHARYCLSENKILRLKFDYCPLTIYVNIPRQTAKMIELESAIEKVPVQVLDCDTISQFKEKTADAIHHTINFSRSLNLSKLTVKWFRDTTCSLILSDDDSSSLTEGEWKRKNTLKHYNVPDGSVLSFISNKEMNNRTVGMMPVLNRNESLNSIKFKSTKSFRHKRNKSLNESTIALIQGNDVHLKEWHLIKPYDSQDDQEDHNESYGLTPEIYFTRLLATKNSLQRFVDELFDAIFKQSNQNNCFPIAIKYMFDFLDDQARKYNITDPEIVHVWKNNCLPLRFWVNLIKNPNFLFDVHKSNIIDSCLSVVAQVFMDSCSTSEQQLSKDSTTTKLLYAQEIPIYNKLVKKYYADIQNIPRISSQDMNTMLEEVSKKYDTDFDTNMSIHKLFKYASKYKENLIDTLKNNEFSKDNLLVWEVEKVMEIMSSGSNF